MNHRYMRRALLVSLVFHGLLMVLFHLWHLTPAVPRFVDQVSISFIAHPPPVAVNPEPAAPSAVVPRTVPHRRLPGVAAGADEVIIAASQPSDTLAAVLVLSDSLPRKFFPIPIPLVDYDPPALAHRTMPELGPLRGAPGTFSDRGAEAMSPNGGSAGPLFDVSTLMAKGIAQLAEKVNAPQPAPVRLRTIPTVAEMAALCAIWDKGAATENEIYSTLPRDIPVTAEDLHGVLTQLAAEGIVSSEIISPRFEFTFMTPLGSAPVEMSAQNRRNRVYRYTSHIDAREMMTFLQAAEYQRSMRAPGDSVAHRLIQNHIQKILNLHRP